jgi:hypothetical protein
MDARSDRCAEGAPMIDRQHGRILVECDSCDTVIEGPKGAEFQELWTAAKEDGWRSKQIGSTWIHSCPGCAGKA